MYVCTDNKVLLTKNEINDILNNSYFYENNLVFVMVEGWYSPEGYPDLTVRDRQDIVKNSIFDHTVIVKGLENYNESISAYARSLGVGTDVHMYITPEVRGTSFDFHVDDRTVFIRKLYGEKSFLVKREGNDLQYELYDGLAIRFQKGEYHKALPAGASALLSFGVADSYSIGKRKFIQVD